MFRQPPKMLSIDFLPESHLAISDYSENLYIFPEVIVVTAVSKLGLKLAYLAAPSSSSCILVI